MVEIPPMTRTERDQLVSFLEAQSSAATPRAEVPTPPDPGIDWPPGNAGEIARYVYGAATRPVKEVAVVATLGLLAGICGRQWTVSNPKSGLNVYLVLIARSAVGKEAMHTGISEIIAACQKRLPRAGDCVDFTDYASGPALIKGCMASRCFVNVSGELGRKFKRLATDTKDSALQSWRTQVVNLYHKSGPSSVAGGLSYSNTDNNVASISGVAYSMIGETTPGTFLESLTSDMMEDGFMSRFTMLEYHGDRPDKNTAVVTEPPAGLITGVCNLILQAEQQCTHNQFMQVQQSAEGVAKLDAFEARCDQQIKAQGDDESRRQMWNRAHLKALRIAALLAVADNHLFPVITLAHADWAVNLVLRDVAAFTKRLSSGDVGDGDSQRMAKLVTVIRDYLVTPVKASYKVPDAMRKNSIVPHNFLLLRVQRQAAFYNHRSGANRALDDTLQSLIASGYLMDVDKNKVIEAYSYHGKGYRVLNLPDATTPK